MIAFRKAHPSLCRSRFWRDDIRWYGVGPQVDLSRASRSLALCLRGASQGEDDVYVMVNAYWEALDFTVQDGAPAEWRLAVDTGKRLPARQSEIFIQFKGVPHSIFASRGAVVQPNKLVGFDPKSSTWFSITPISKSGGGTVRHMTFHRPTRTLWFGTDANTIGRAVVP